MPGASQRTYRLPHKVSDARVLVGAKIEVYWQHSTDPNANEDWPEGWYAGVVGKVTRPSLEGTSKILLLVRYEDDQEELEWDEVFNGAAMPGKSNVRVTPHTQEATDFIASLCSPAKRRMTPAHSQLKRIKTDPDAVSSSQAMQDSTAHSNASQPASFAEQQPRKQAMASNTSQQSSNPSMAELGLTGMDDDFSPGSDEHIPPNKRQRTNIPARTNSQRRREAAAEIQPRFNLLVQPGPGVGTSGQIARIRLENFMCHDHLEMELTPHVNFICGSNGSGKSASLQAVQCCLGVKAKDTGRAAKIEAFIKTGCSHAMAAVTLWNTGHDAFSPTIYGSQITIERRITKSSSTFTIRDAMRRKVGDGTRAQVDDILDHFNINAGNPATCMTQDLTRSFAGESRDTEKFALYMAATHFAETMQNLVDAQELVDEMQGILHKQSSVFEAKRAELKEIDQKVRDIQVVEQWQHLQDLYGKVLPWEQYYTVERSVKAHEDKCNRALPERYAKITMRHSEAAAELSSIEQEYQAQKQALQDFQPQMEDLQKRQKEQHLANRTANQALHAAHRQVSDCQANLAELATDKAQLQQSAEDLQATMAASSQAAVDQHAAAIRTQQRATEQAEYNASLARQAVNEADAAVQQADKGVKRAVAASRDRSGQVKEILADLDRLQHSQRRPVQAFAAKGCPPAVYDRFLNRVAEAQGQFHRPPVGPIGSYLTLAEERWGVAVEMACGRALGNFIVHDFQDQRLLQRLAQQAGLRGLSVYIVNFDMPLQDIHAGRVPAVPSHLTTLLQVLTFPEEQGHIIQNALIIQHSIERQVLVDSTDAAFELIRQQSRAQGAAAAVINRCYTAQGDQVYARKSTVTHIPVNHAPRPRLQRDFAGQIAQVQLELESAQAASAAAAQELQAARNDERDARRMRDTANSGKQRADRAKLTADSQLQDLTSQQPDDADTAGAAVQETLSEIADRDAQMRSLQRQLEELQAAQATAQGAIDTARTDTEAVRASMQDLQVDNQRCLEAVESVAGRREIARDQMRYYRDKEQECTEQMEAANATLASYMTQQRALELQTAQVCTQEEEAAAREELIQIFLEQDMPEEDIKLNLQVDQLEQQLTKLNARISQKEREAGADLQTLKAMQQRLSNQVAKLEVKFSKVQQAHDVLDEGVQKRQTSCARIRADTEQQTNILFNLYLSKRGFRGSLKLYYQPENNKRLEVKVQLPSEAGKKSVVKDMKTLSGGEKSYTTVCFITALAHAISSPFHCMDEFDVFMDEVNRRICMRLLLTFAIQNSDRQLILLSPQDITGVEQARREMQHDFPNPEHFFKLVQMRHARTGANQS